MAPRVDEDAEGARTEASYPDSLGGDVPPVWSGVHREEGQAILFADVRGQGDVGDGAGEPLSEGGQRAIHGGEDAAWEDAGSPPSNGDASWPAIAEDGTRSPHQREPGGQPNREPGVTNAVGPRTGTQPLVPHAVAPYSTVPQLVLDPFAGACTTLLVANQLGRRAIGFELNPSYARMGEERIRADAPLVEAVAAAEVWQQPDLFEGRPA